MTRIPNFSTLPTGQLKMTTCFKLRIVKASPESKPVVFQLQYSMAANTGCGSGSFSRPEENP